MQRTLRRWPAGCFRMAGEGHIFTHLPLWPVSSTHPNHPTAVPNHAPQALVHGMEQHASQPAFNPVAATGSGHQKWQAPVP